MLISVEKLLIRLQIVRLLHPQNVTIKMNFDTKLQTVDKDQLKMSMTSTLNMLGQTMDMNMYYSDGYIT